MKGLYLYVNFFTILVPFLFSFHPRLQFYRFFRHIGLAIFFSGAIFIAWDIVFTQIGVWGFNPKYVSGLYISNLPVEEVLFFVCIPFACVFTYHCLNIFFKPSWSRATENAFVLVMVLLLVAGGIVYHDKLYSAATFFSLAAMLLLFRYVFKIEWLAKLVLIYPVLLIPFFIVNGILTGSGLPEPVVWYNNSENMNLRLGTIPFEDVFYGFELILLNVFCFEFLKKRWYKPI